MLFGKYLNKYYLRYLPILMLGLVSLIAIDYIQLIVPELYRSVINGINLGTATVGGDIVPFDMDYLLTHICMPLIVIILCMVCGRFLWRVCFFIPALKVEASLRSKMFDRCRTLSPEYYQVNKVGDLMSLFTNDLETVQDCFGWGLMMFCDALFLGILAITKMWKMDYVLTLFSLIPMAFLLIIGTFVDKSLTEKWEKRQEALSSISDFSQESFSGIAVIKAFVKEVKYLLSFRKLNKDNENANVDFTRTSTLLHIFVTLFVESVICIILGYGGFLVYKGAFNAGELVEFIGYFTAVVWPIMAVSELIGMHSRGKASLNRISEVLDTEPIVKDREGLSSAGSLSGAIEFSHLSFKYPGSNLEVLSDITLKIEAGENVGIIGKTGCGKTTLVDLILRTYNIPDGTLFIDGKDVNEIPIKELRDHAAYVPQDNFLFSDTIQNNIALSKTDATEEEVIASAKAAAVHSNIDEFKEKYATVLGERGVTVSGGQKQRISIARALIKDAPILILDDSVSAVDVKTEEEILSNLKELRKGKTTLLTAHRVSTVRQMDKIIFLSDGKLAAYGTHEELYESCPEYRTEVELQRLDAEKEAN